jgi:hypothetical protein
MRMHVCVRARARSRVCVRACVCVYVCVCVSACLYVGALHACVWVRASLCGTLLPSSQSGCRRPSRATTLCDTTPRCRVPQVPGMLATGRAPPGDAGLQQISRPGEPRRAAPRRTALHCTALHHRGVALPAACGANASSTGHRAARLILPYVTVFGVARRTLHVACCTSPGRPVLWRL